jgi:hypothetical protein
MLEADSDSIIGAMAKTLSNVLFSFIFLKLASGDRRALASIAHFGVKRHATVDETWIYCFAVPL